MRQLFTCLRAGHFPRMHYGPRATICLRCIPCLTCGTTGQACIGRCVAEPLS